MSSISQQTIEDPMSKKPSQKNMQDDSGKKGHHMHKDLPAASADQVKGGKPLKADGTLDAGIHFKYDIKGNKEG
jgi:hypothetical protein